MRHDDDDCQVLNVNIAPIEIRHSFSSEQFTQIVAQLTRIEVTLKDIQMTDAEVKVVLTGIDATTTKISSNLDTVASVQQSEADTIQTISNEVDALVANAANNGISPETATQLQGIADRLQASSDKSDATVTAIKDQVPVLVGIAAKGAPVVPAPPPAPSV